MWAQIYFLCRKHNWEEQDKHLPHAYRASSLHINVSPNNKKNKQTYPSKQWSNHSKCLKAILLNFFFLKSHKWENDQMGKYAELFLNSILCSNKISIIKVEYWHLIWRRGKSWTLLTTAHMLFLLASIFKNHWVCKRSTCLECHVKGKHTKRQSCYRGKKDTDIVTI